jgi:hypothetical protein
MAVDIAVCAMWLCLVPPMCPVPSSTPTPDACPPGLPHSVDPVETFISLKSHLLLGDSMGGCAGRTPLCPVCTSASPSVFVWPQRFPAVFGDGRGGFDAVVGNPPWKILDGDDKSAGESVARHFKYQVCFVSRVRLSAASP